jgi:hypothetical protein
MFFLPGQIQIAAPGEITWGVRRSRFMYQCGVKFVSIYSQVRTEIEKFVAANPQAA